MANSNKKLFRNIFIFILVVGAIGGVYGLYEFNRGKVDRATEKPDISLKASDLADSILNNAEGFQKRYLDKMIEVEGTIVNKSEDENKSINLFVDEKGVSIQCTFFSKAACEKNKQSVDLAHANDVVNLKKGDKLKFKGNFTGYTGDPSMPDLGMECKLSNGALVSK